MGKNNRTHMQRATGNDCCIRHSEIQCKAPFVPTALDTSVYDRECDTGGYSGLWASRCTAG
jgi:hypothetical protein